MRPFTFRVEISTDAISAAIGPFLEVVGYQNLERRIDGLASRVRANNFALSIFAERHVLEIQLWRIISRFRKYGRLPSLHSSTESDQLRAYAFIWLLGQVYAHLGEMARKRLKGRIRHGFTDEGDLLSIEHELNTIAHLCRFGCLVSCHGLGTAPQESRDPESHRPGSRRGRARRGACTPRGLGH